MSASRKLPSAAILLAVAARVLPFMDVREACVWLESRIGRWRVGWGLIALVSGLAEGQEPLVRLHWVRRLTESQQSQDAAWDIDRLEPEGSCRIGTHCQRVGYHHRLPALEGGRGREERGMEGRGGRGEDGRSGWKQASEIYSAGIAKGSRDGHDMRVIGVDYTVTCIVENINNAFLIAVCTHCGLN